MRVRSEWHGDDIVERAGRAAGRAVIGIGEQVVADAKSNAHVVTGTLRRSIHLAPVGYGGDDESTARAVTIPNIGEATEQGDSHLVEAGSWLPYACVEETGRGHQFITPAVENVRGIAPALIRQAFAEEGLL